jgi:hypothetical protein
MLAARSSTRQGDRSSSTGRKMGVSQVRSPAKTRVEAAERLCQRDNDRAEQRDLDPSLADLVNRSDE